MNNMRFPTTSPFNEASSYQFDISHGIDLRESYGGFDIPDFQRELVWDENQNRLFIESIILRYPIGSYVYNQDLRGEKPMFELLDGQQRWNAIFEYVDDKFKVMGYKWSDLNTFEQFHIKHCVFPVLVTERLERDTKIEIYERLAYGGTPHIAQQ